MEILIIEDNQDIAANIADYLEPRGHALDFAIDGAAGLALAASGRFDVIVLDLMLPRMDGLTVCRKLREEAQLQTPVLMLTARDTLDDKLEGFRSGTDDYLVKPFSVKELEVRLEALVKRSSPDVSARRLTVGDLTFDRDSLVAVRANQTIDLNPAQRKLLETLLLKSPNVVSREELEHVLWGESPPDRDILRTHIYTLRNLVDKPFPSPLIQTVHGVGYRLVAEEPQ